MKTITFANHKGGVGKTTSAYNTAAALAMKGYRVLAVDLDAQRNLTECLTRRDYEAEGLPTIEAVIFEGKDFPAYGVAECLDICPGALAMIKAPASQDVAANCAERIRRAVQTAGRDYDFIVFDCPPGVANITVNTISCTDYLIVVLTADMLAVNGMAHMEAIAQKLQKKIAGYLLTMYSNNNLSKSIRQQLKDRHGALLFDTVIRKNVSLAEAPLTNTSIFNYAPESNGACDYMAFTEELLKRI